ncbi:MAG: phage baseplate assembly protein V [Bacteroidales bacterium]
MNHVAEIVIEISGYQGKMGNKLESFSHLSLQQSVFGHHSLEIVCRRDTLEEEGNFVLSNSANILGKEIKLKISTEQKHKNEFIGIITQVSASKTDGPMGGDIVISAESPDIKLDDGEHCRSFEKKTLEKIIKQVLKEYSFDTKNIKPEKSTDPNPYIVQYKESAYAFINRLAAKKGEWFFYNGTDLVFGALPSKSVDLQYGIDLFNFDFSLKLDDLKFKYMAYDYLNEKVISSDSGSQSVSKMSAEAKIAYDHSEKLYTHETLSLYNHALSESDAKGHLDDKVLLIKKSQTSGFVTVNGSSDNPNLILGCEINIKETIKKEDRKEKKVEHGTYIVTSLSHSCDRTGNYQNSFTAIPVDIEVPPFTTPHAIPFCETQSAKVMDNNDPEAMGRIRVQFFWQQDENTVSPWIRVITPHSGLEKGMYFIPEIGDEVLVAFEGGNAEKPYVLGSLYHGKAKPDTLFDKDNNIKAIRTRSGHTIEFIDKDGSEEMKIYDYNKENYVITLSTHESKIKVESLGDIEMVAQGDFNIEAIGDLKVKANNIQMESNMDYDMKTTNMKIDAASNYEAKGTNMKSEANAQMVLKAAPLWMYRPAPK